MKYNKKILNPGLAFFVFIMIGAVLSTYGVSEGSAYIFCFLAGVIIYKSLQ